MFRKLQTSILHLPITYFILWVFTVLVYFGLQYYFKELSKKDNILTSLELGIRNELVELGKEAEIASSIIKAQPVNYWNAYNDRYSDSDKFILLFKNDSLVYWNNKYLSGDIHNVKVETHHALETKNGFYLIDYYHVNEYSIYISSRLKSKSSITNQKNTTVLLGPFFSYNDIEFTLDQKDSDHKIFSKSGDFIIGINNLKEQIIGNKMINVLFIAYLFAYVFFLTWLTLLYFRIKHLFKHASLLYLVIITDTLIIRFIDYLFRIPYMLKESYIFEIQFNNFISFNSLGDLIINSLVLLFISIQLRNYLSSSAELKRNSKFKQVLLYLLVWTSGILVFTLVYKIIIQLPFNSFYGIDIGSNELVFIFTAVLLYIISLVILAHSVFSILIIPTGPNLFTFVIIGLFISLLTYYILNINFGFVLVITFSIIIIYFVYFIFSLNEQSHFYKYLIIIIIISSVSAYSINSARKNKKDNNQTNTLISLTETTDNFLEKRFKEFVEAIDVDTTLIYASNNTISNNKSEYENYLLRTYFSNVATKYDIQITICLMEDMLELQPEGLVVNCSEYFDKYIDDFENVKRTENLFLIPDKPESTYYFGKKRIKTLDSEIDLYFEFYFTYVPEGLGYPELLLSKAAMDIDLSGYSIARYTSDQLDYKYGEFPYYTNLEYMKSYPAMALFNLNGFWHIKQKISDDSYLIISRPNEKLAVQLVSFSVLFIVFVLLIFFISLVLFSERAIQLLKMSFQNRLQIIFISAIGIIIILLSSITLFYINIDNQNRLTKQLTEKTNSVIVELQHKLGDVPDLYSIEPVELEMLLKKFSLVFFSDINLYSPTGELISSSRPEIFKRGLLSENINPKAYCELFINNKLFFITQEDLASITYYSSYAPLMLNSNQPAGIINLPYFAKQSEVTKSYYQMIFTFINLFVFLAIIGTILVLLLSRIITKPLVVLQRNLAEIQIDKQNAIIDWKGNDEIGQLINAYNQMIHKLEQSTELLKQSERESAWREVAQQIAHEIKNPLTPMKLNVQYLEKAFREKDPGLDEKVKNISEMLIAQIETLNKVAEMFSDFTKTKTRKFERVDLQGVIKKSIQLFKNHPDTSFNFIIEQGGDYYTKAFEKDLLRVFNNLIKNSLQSMDKPTGREIEIKLNKFENRLVVEFTDNGKGISDEVKSNIFKPYFTTKSTGTGLGLAIVKNIMNEIGGEITLLSTTTDGTCFVLQFQAN